MARARGRRRGQGLCAGRAAPFWQLTSEQDWDLCEKNQAGVNSSAFTPGPYSTKREYNVIRYTEWYLHAIARPEHPEGSVARSV